jgi:hypothetical protein
MISRHEKFFRKGDENPKKSNFFKYYLQNSTINGVKYIVDSNHWFARYVTNFKIPITLFEF